MAVSCVQLYRDAVSQLVSAGLSNAANEAMWILEHTIGVTRMMVHASPNLEVSGADQRQAWRYIKRRAAGEPIQYLLGTEEFWGLEFVVPRGVLIPRPDSEVLIPTVLPHVTRIPTPLIVDVGTGTGCLAVALGKELPRARILATDRSPLAVQTAKHNAARHQVSHQMEFCVADLLSPLLSRGLAGKVAGIVANLPYISHDEWEQLPHEVREYEPRLALDGGLDGLVHYRDLLSQAKGVLRPQGVIVLEAGAGQAQILCQEVRELGMYEVHEIRRDTLGIERAICLMSKV